jgi:pimeloyl-ACP methyl ester carboxylesterase
MNRINNIVLVHGFWADGSSYNQITAQLLTEGYEVIAVQNPLTSLADDVAVTKRVLNRIEGRCILVGHSWGGMVISEAGNDEKVSGLVYIAALAPEAEESMADLFSKYESPSQYFQEQEEFIWISQEGVEKILANDLPIEKAALIYATQTPASASLLTAKITIPAWKKKPSWYIVANQDRAVPPELQFNLAQRIGARTVVLESGHVPIISHASEVVAVIKEASSIG